MRASWICGFAVTLSSTVSADGPFYNPGTDGYYEFVAAPGITWQEAKEAAENSVHEGLPGYLVTITSDEENQFLYSHFSGREHVFIGATDEAVEGEWRWVTGPETGTLFWLGDMNGQPQAYARWDNEEPNNCCEGEQYGEWLGRNGGVWNDGDSNATGRSEGFLVEYRAVGGRFRRADANGDGSLNIGDPVRILNYLFATDRVECLDTADTDDNGQLEVTDAIVLLGYLFLGTIAPGEPFDACGIDVGADLLDCQAYPPCE